MILEPCLITTALTPWVMTSKQLENQLYVYENITKENRIETNLFYNCLE